MAPTLAELTTTGNQAALHRGPVMPFGKHRGMPLVDLPNEYLVWMSGLDDLRQPLLKQVLHEMGRRVAAIEAQP